MSPKAAIGSLFAVTAPGFEATVAEELTALGASDVAAQDGGVAFGGGAAAMMTANLQLRGATRVLEVVQSGRVRAFEHLERLARDVDWGRLLPRRVPIRVRVSSRKSRLFHQGAVAERVMRAIGRKAVSGEADPNQTGEVWVRLQSDALTISVDTSGERLHRRGYRLQTARAPLRESLAAGILLQLGWRGAVPLLDPMCGSGTFPIEAAWIAGRRAPGLMRRFAFERRPGFERDAWEALRAEARRAVVAPAVELIGSDRANAAIQAARANGERAGVSVVWQVVDVDWIAGADGPPGLVLINPPYGRRIGAAEGAMRAIEGLKCRLDGWRFAVLYAFKGPIPDGFQLVTSFRNGGLKVRLITS